MSAIVKGNKYYFDFHILEADTDDEDDNSARNNNGCICEVVRESHHTKHGNVYEVRNVETGDWFFAYEPELGELIGNW